MKYYLWVLGCAMNYSDAERISSVLDLAGFKKTTSQEDADLIVTVSCSVRQSAINRIYGKKKDWDKLKKKNPNLRTILTGCVLKRDRQKMAKMFDCFFQIEDLGQLPAILGRTDGDNETEKIGKSGEYLGVIPAYESSFRAFVPIMTGCNNFCTYCAVPYTRGREKSRQPAEILSEISALLRKNYKEITLLGQNVNSYEFGFADLLEKIDRIPGDYRVYFYSNHPKDMSDDLILRVSKLSHFPSYIHLPLQSGNNEILGKMNRHYTSSDYLKLATKIKKTMPGVTLTTDIIVGFPGETNQMFLDTKKTMERVGFDMAFIAQYSPRPGAKSSKLVDDVSSEEKKLREEILVEVLRKSALEHNKSLIGTTQKVLIDGVKRDNYYGRTSGYKVVEIPTDSAGKTKTDQAMKPGQFCDVIIRSATAWKLKADSV